MLLALVVLVLLKFRREELDPLGLVDIVVLAGVAIEVLELHGV